MKILFICFSFLLFINACDIKHPPEEVDPNAVFDVMDTYNSDSCYPYDTYKSLLDKSLYKDKYGNVMILDDNFSKIYYNSSSFNKDLIHLDDENNLVFFIDKEKNSPKVSSKLLQKDTWFTSDEDGNYFISKLRFLKPENTNSYTVMQAHGVYKEDSNSSIYYNYPLLQIVWRRYYGSSDKIYDHLWAIVTKSAPGDDEPKIYEWIDLGPREDNEISLEVHISHNIMEVKLNYTTLTIQNVSYWERVPTYFDAGVSIDNYIDKGKACVVFKQLRFEDDPQNVENITHF